MKFFHPYIVWVQTIRVIIGGIFLCQSQPSK
jgi:hypothetical protein